MNIEAYKVIIFDLFHTLTSLETAKPTAKGTKDILGVSRKEWNDQLLLYSEDRLRGWIKDPFEIIEKMAHAINPEIPEALIRKAVDNRIERFKYSLEHIAPATIDTLKRLKSSGKMLGLISNGDVNEISGWDDSPLKECFDCVVFSCAVGYIKPEKEIYEMCFNELGVLPRECIYVGDGGSDELKGAKELGMTTVLTTHVVKEIWPEKIEERRKYADYEIDEIRELLEE